MMTSSDVGPPAGVKFTRLHTYDNGLTSLCFAVCRPSSSPHAPHHPLPPSPPSFLFLRCPGVGPRALPRAGKDRVMERASLPSPPAATPAAPADRAMTTAGPPKRPRAAPKTDQVCTSHGPCRPRPTSHTATWPP
eukprot:scaffold118494_cov34-Tisochrysis_lutea.AAC.2